MPNDDRDQRRDRPPPPAIRAQLAGPRRDRGLTPVEGTPIEQINFRIKRASETTWPDIQDRVTRLEARSIDTTRDVGVIAERTAAIAGAAEVLDEKLVNLREDVTTLIEAAEAERGEAQRAREAARADRAARAARAATMADADKERLTKRQIAVLAIVPSTITALVALLAVLLK